MPDYKPNDPKSPDQAQMHLDSCAVRCFISIRTKSYPSYQGAKWAELPNTTRDLISTRTESCASYHGANWPELPRVVEDLISRRTESYRDVQGAKWTELPKIVDMNNYK